jgi:hypothetical protein
MKVVIVGILGAASPRLPIQSMLDPWREVV